MSANRRATAALPPTVRGVVLVRPAEVSQAIEAAWLMGCGVHIRIIGHTQYVNLCTVELLIKTFGDEERKFAPAVEEPEEGGAV